MTLGAGRRHGSFGSFGDERRAEWQRSNPQRRVFRAIRTGKASGTHEKSRTHARTFEADVLRGNVRLKPYLLAAEDLFAADQVLECLPGANEVRGFRDDQNLGGQGFGVVVGAHREAVGAGAFDDEPFSNFRDG